MRDLQTFTFARNAASSAVGAITLAGFIRHSRGLWDGSMRVLGSYALVYVLDGGGRYEDDRGTRARVEAGDLILVFPEIGHRYGPDADGHWSEIYFVFEGPLFDVWRHAGLLSEQAPIRRLRPVEQWLRRFESVLGSPREPGYAPPLLEVCRLQAVLAEALVAGPSGAAGPGYQDRAEWASRACAMLEADLTGPVDLAALARGLNMSYETFRRRFRDVMGVPPARYRAQRLIDRACELMQAGRLTDRQIADRLGFCDPYHFSKRFKQIVGCTPRQYRNRLPRTPRASPDGAGSPQVNA